VPLHCWAFFSGLYDDHKIAVLRNLMRPGGVAVDVGANIGFYAVPLAIHAKEIGGKVVAFEPVKNNVAWLQSNLVLNQCEDVVHIVESALGNEVGSAEIVLLDDFSGGGMVGNATITDNAIFEHGFARFDREKVKIDTFDRVWSDKGRIDVIKIDIEGNETQFLEGGKATIASHRPVLLIEVNLAQQALRNIKFSEAVPLLLPDGYSFFEVRRNSAIEIKDLTDCADADVLAIPEERRVEMEFNRHVQGG
jgi:FkbM family methyltransferase